MDNVSAYADRILQFRRSLHQRRFNARGCSPSLSLSLSFSSPFRYRDTRRLAGSRARHDDRPRRRKRQNRAKPLSFSPAYARSRKESRASRRVASRARNPRRVNPRRAQTVAQITPPAGDWRAGLARPRHSDLPISSGCGRVIGSARMFARG